MLRPVPYIFLINVFALCCVGPRSNVYAGAPATTQADEPVSIVVYAIGTGATIQCDSAKLIRSDAKGQISIRSSADSAASVRKAAQAFIAKPPPFLTIDRFAVDGFECGTTVRVGAAHRSCFVGNWTVPVEMETLLNLLASKVAADGGNSPDANNVALYLRTMAEGAKRNMLEEHRHVVIDNDEPESLLAALMNSSNGRPDERHVVHCVCTLADMRGIKLGPLIWKRLEEQGQKFSADSRLQLAAASIESGSPRALPLFRSLLHSLDEKHYSEDLQHEVDKIIDQSARPLVLKAAGVEGNLDAKATERLWSWLVSNKDRLAFDDETHTYHLTTEIRTGK